VLAAVAASAVAFGLYSRFAWPWLVLGWVGLVPWLAVLERTTSLGEALAAGLVMCVAFVLAVFAWFADAMRTYTGASWPLALVVMVLLAPLLEPQLVAFALARHLARRRWGGWWRPALVGAAAYVGSEWVSPKLFCDTLGYGLTASAWMRQAADLAGAPGLTFVILLVNEGVLAALRGATSPGRTRLRAALAPAASAAALVLGVVVYGAVRYRQFSADDASGATVTAGIVQADISQYDRLAAEVGKYDAVRGILDAHFALSTELLGRARLDLLVWPETVYPTTFGAPKTEAGAAFDGEIAGFVSRTGVPLVFGAYDVEGTDEFNAAVFLEPATAGPLSFDTYRKATLFPLTERVPAVLESALVRQWLPWLGTWKPGAGSQVVPLTLPDGRVLRIAPLICYDALEPRLALGAVARGAELIVTLSNDSWFGTGPGAQMHLVGATFRSIETRRPQVRATNTGISAVISATGDVLEAAGVDQRATLVATVAPERAATTLMVAWGDWFGPVAAACATVLLGVSLLPGRRRT
jgi:apolipoprotein N-acyltransferase